MLLTSDNSLLRPQDFLSFEVLLYARATPRLKAFKLYAGHFIRKRGEFLFFWVVEVHGDRFIYCFEMFEYRYAWLFVLSAPLGEGAGASGPGADDLEYVSNDVIDCCSFIIMCRFCAAKTRVV